MSAWKRKAIALFPEFGRDLQESDYTLYQFYFDLRPATVEAHRQRNDEFLRKAHGFAEWCMSRSAKDLWNSAGLCFYEDLVEEKELWPAIAPWLSPSVIADAHGLWEWVLGEAIGEFDDCLGSVKRHRYPETVFGTGEIHDL